MRKELFHVFMGRAREDYRNSGDGSAFQSLKRAGSEEGSEIQIDTGTPSDGKAFQTISGGQTQLSTWRMGS